MKWLSLLFLFALPVQVYAQVELPPDLLEAEQQRIETIAKVSPAVVAIFPPDGKGGGSGVLISADGITLTNFHVVQGAGPFLKCGLNDGKVYDAVLMGIDPTGDVAIIKMLGRDDFPFAPLGNSDTVEAGDWAFAMGNPFLLAEDFRPTLTFGMVSGVHRYQYPAGTFLEYTDCIQVDTSINPGNSGGPLFNTSGEVIGINGRISVEKRGRVNAGAGYAISINQIKHFSDHLMSGRVVDHATLGATVRSDEFSNVIVDTILPNSDAFHRGLRSGDEIITFGGRPIGSVNQFKNILGIYPKGWKVPLEYRREGERKTVFVRLEALHSIGELLEFAKAAPTPAPENEEEPQPEEKPLPPLHPMLGQAKPPEMPEEYKHLYEARSGFSNYYFNRIKQEELLSALKPLGNFGGADAKWTMRGTLSDQSEFRIALTAFASLLEIPDQQLTALLDVDTPETYAAGYNEEGMLMALRHLQILLTAGAQGFTECYYIGSEPLDGTGEKVEILQTMKEGREVRWYFSKEANQLVGWDYYADPSSPECGLRILGWTASAHGQRPAALKLQVPGRDPIDLQINEFELGTAEKPKTP